MKFKTSLSLLKILVSNYLKYNENNIIINLKYNENNIIINILNELNIIIHH